MPLPLLRVACPAVETCGWRGYRRRVTSRPCPWCGIAADKIVELWQAGQGPGVWRTYLLCFQWPDGWRRDPTDWRYLLTPTGERIQFHAQHYTGKTTRALPARLAEHLAGNGAGVVRAAIALGATPRLARAWETPRVQSTREWRFKRRGRRQPTSSTCGTRRGVRRGMTRYCPFCKEGT